MKVYTVCIKSNDYHPQATKKRSTTTMMIVTDRSEDAEHEIIYSYRNSHGQQSAGENV